jgi:hypothetical protein
VAWSYAKVLEIALFGLFGMAPKALQWLGASILVHHLSYVNMYSGIASPCCTVTANLEGLLSDVNY